MKNWFKKVSIENFKSLQQVELNCKRVNVFIGKPNSGKSNILEALSLFAPQFPQMALPNFMHDVIRYDDLTNWFYDEDLSRRIKVLADEIGVLIQYEPNADSLNYLFAPRPSIPFYDKMPVIAAREIGSDFDSRNPSFPKKGWQFILVSTSPKGQSVNGTLTPSANSPLKTYLFKNEANYHEKFSEFLLPPHGTNLFGVVDHTRSLRLEIAEMFEQYGLKFVLSRRDGKFELQKEVDNIVYKYPYTSMADTFKRLIFYLAAIETNRNSILVLEEPEVHSFPPYTKMLADRIALSDENQFFLTTHSPYMLNTLIETVPDSELAVHHVYFEDYETRVHTLTPDELTEVVDFSIDVFFNLDKFRAHGESVHA